MLNILSVIPKDSMNSDYYQLENCGIYDSSVKDYYVVLPKTNFDEFCSMLGAETPPEKRDILNKINLNQIKPIVLEMLETHFDSITGHLCDIYEDEDGMLAHYGLIESSDYDDFGEINDFDFDSVDLIEDNYEPASPVIEEQPVFIQEEEEIKPIVTNLSNETSTIEEPVGIIENENPEEEVNIEDKVEEINEVKDETCVANLQKESNASYEYVIEEPRTNAVYDKALEILATKVGLDYNELMRQAECEVATEANPDFTLEEVQDALELLLEYKSVTDFECEFIENMYKAGNVHEVTQLLASKIDLLGGDE